MDAKNDYSGWDAHQLTRFQATVGTTFLERMQWLEGAAETVRRLHPRGGEGLPPNGLNHKNTKPAKRGQRCAESRRA